MTLDNCGVPPKDVFVHHVHCIPLPDNCNQTPVSGFTISRTSTYTLVSVIRSIVTLRSAVREFVRRYSTAYLFKAFESLSPHHPPPYSIRLRSRFYPIHRFFPTSPPFLHESSHESKNERPTATTREKANLLANLFLLSPCLRSIPYDCPSAT